jgi:hypothetical protein
MVLSRPDLSSEVLLKNRSDLRLCCAICAGDPDIARQLAESRKGHIDWMALIEVAKNHRLEMLLYRAVNSGLAEFAGSSALEALRSLYADNLARFKGPVLAAQLFGDIALRIYGDLDLLIRECDAATVTRIMADQGYRASAMSLGWERSFVRANGDSVDVHWSIAEKIHQFPLTADELWARRATTTLAGVPRPVSSTRLRKARSGGIAPRQGAVSGETSAVR